jgi:hypothetical protein
MPDDMRVSEAASDDRGRQDWALKSRRYIKRELKQREITYEQLADRLSEMGIHETPGSIAMKIARGLYPAWFFFAVMRAIGCQHMRFEDLG